MMDDAASAQFSDLSDQSIGEILISVGRISPDDAERIFREQKKQKVRFGEAAIALGLATEADIQYALSHQFRYPYLQRGESKVSETVVAAYDPFSPQVEALRAIRSQLMLRWFGGSAGRRVLAIVSPGHGEGRSWFAANLAVVFSQLGARTLLIDTDLRAPTLHRLFGISNRNGLSSILSGRATGNVVFRVPSLIDLSILPSGPVPPNPQELLTRPLLDRMVAQLSNSFDVILIDTPSSARYAESVSIASRAGGALIVCRQDQTRVRDFDTLCSRLVNANIMIAGSVLNDVGGKANNAETWIAQSINQGATAVSRLRQLKALSNNSRSKSSQQRPIRTVLPDDPLDKVNVMTEGAVVLDVDSVPASEKP
ncbi:MAG: chain length determinant protein tyrosine kinase EpsG [Betaproteobacteria bacterium]|nr:chain length determinant protein tyrosine kinase EpsG [Betaproteobacteria bacterium]